MVHKGEERGIAMDAGKKILLDLLTGSGVSAQILMGRGAVPATNGAHATTCGHVST